MKKVIITMLAIIMMFSMAACGGGSAADENAATINVAITIDYPDGTDLTDVEADVTVPEGATVLDVLNTYAEANDLEVSMGNSSSMTYVEVIGGVEPSGMEGWVFDVNGEMIMEASDKYEVSEGDTVNWLYGGM